MQRRAGPVFARSALPQPPLQRRRAPRARFFCGGARPALASRAGTRGGSSPVSTNKNNTKRRAVCWTQVDFMQRVWFVPLAERLPLWRNLFHLNQLVAAISGLLLTSGARSFEPVFLWWGNDVLAPTSIVDGLSVPCRRWAESKHNGFHISKVLDSKVGLGPRTVGCGVWAGS